MQRVQHLLHSHPAISPLLVLVVSFLVFTYLNPNFGTLRTQSLILQQVAVVGALAVGQTLIILTAGIDLSCGAIAILAMLYSAKLSADSGIPGPVAILIGIAVGTAAGRAQRPAGDPAQAAAVHRDPRDAVDLHRDGAALLERPERPGRARCRP